MSARKYDVVTCDANGYIMESITIQSLMRQPRNNEVLPEWIYAMQDIIDTVLDLKIGDSIHFQSNRDDINSKGLIYRCS